MQKAKTFDWRLSALGAGAAFIAVVPAFAYGLDFGVFLQSLLLFGMLALALLVVSLVNLRCQLLAVAAMLGLFVTLTAIFLKIAQPSRTAVRWLLHSKAYQAEVLRQPAPADGSLRHTEWDGWGMAGAETTEYLIYNSAVHPTLPAGTAPYKLSGVPCDVWKVQQVEDHWYIVTYYTNTDWDHCD